ncbi:hypothetical protein JYT57_00575 [Nitrosarchaeum koreense]|nr:hypothetical protein [Nitrosarchaeum koreense]
MVTKKVFLVFGLPVILSVIFGSAVMNDILQEPNRELNMWPMSFSESPSYDGIIEIIGLSHQYSISEPVEIKIKVNDSSFDCGDLYVTIYSSGQNVVTQGGYFEQCFEEGNYLLPIGDTFSEIVDTPGSYEIVAEMVSKELKNISIRGVFTVK